MLNRLFTAATMAVALTIAFDAHAQFLVGEPTDDAWMYEHAGDPGGDPVIRVWGTAEDDINPSGYPGDIWTRAFWSYGYISWDLSDVPNGFEWNGATITLTVEDGTVYDPATDNIYLRILTEGFDEDTIVYGVGPAPVGGDLNRLEADDTHAANGAGSLVIFDIPKTVPRSVLLTWAQNRRMDIAITSTADFAEDSHFFRFASNNNLLYDGPILELK